MAGLLSDLSLGSSALLAQQAGVDVTGRNTANLNTEGYLAVREPLRGFVTDSGYRKATEEAVKP